MAERMADRGIPRSSLSTARAGRCWHRPKRTWRRPRPGAPAHSPAASPIDCSARHTTSASSSSSVSSGGFSPTFIPPRSASRASNSSLAVDHNSARNASASRRASLRSMNAPYHRFLTEPDGVQRSPVVSVATTPTSLRPGERSNSPTRSEPRDCSRVLAALGGDVARSGIGRPGALGMWPSTTAECASPSHRRVLAGYRRRRSASHARARVRSPATWKPVARAAICKSRGFRSLSRSLGDVWACKHWAERVCVTVSKTAASGSTPGSPVLEELCSARISRLLRLNVALGAAARALTILNGSAQGRSRWGSHARLLALRLRLRARGRALG